MTTTEIRDGLREVGQAVSIPALDRTAFQREVRRARRARAGERLALAGAAAAVVAAGVVVAPYLTPDSTVVDPPASGTPEGPPEGTVYVIADGRLVALDSSGTQHDVGARAEGLLGFRGGEVFVVSTQSRVEAFAEIDDPEGPDPAGFRSIDVPAEDPVSSAALSADGRFLAWLDLEGVVHRYDLVAGRDLPELPLGRDSYLVDVSASGVLVAQDGGLSLRDDDGRIDIVADDDTWASQVVGDRVLVSGSGGTTRLYDVSSGVARQVVELPGDGSITAAGDRVLFFERSADDSTTVRLWDGTGTRPVTGVDGTVDRIRWVDDGSDAGTFLLTGYADGPALWSCDLAGECQRLAVDAERLQVHE
jgi:hypothetical protein